jgi:hypothetical protein
MELAQQMQNYIYIGHSDFKDSPYWESQMLANNVFTVTGKDATGRPLDDPHRALAQVEVLIPAEVLLMHHNAGNATSGIKAITVTRTGASAPVPVNASVTPIEYIRTVKVEPWIVLDEVLTHAEIEARIGRLSSKIKRTVSKIEGDFATQLVDLFFAKLARQFNAKSVK